MFSGHDIGLLKEYMRDLVEQATQEQHSQEQFGFTPLPYRPDQAFSDLLALLDDRIESEGIQVGLPECFLHDMWTLSGLPRRDGTKVSRDEGFYYRAKIDTRTTHHHDSATGPSKRKRPRLVAPRV